MNRKRIAVIVGIIVAIVIAAVVIMAAFGGHDTPKPTDPTNTPTVPTTQGTDPTQDTEPTVPPTEPTDPDVPTDPTDPEGPTDPTDPTDPAGPTDPTDPTDPTEPDQPTDPTEPEKPTEPTEPVHSHDYKAEKKVEPTCTEEGYTLYVCECGDSYHGANTAALGHSNEEKVTEPTCEKEGYTTYTCVRCGHTEKGNTVKAKGHAYGEWKVETEPTCEKEGKNVRTCATCGKEDTETVPAVDHEYEEKYTEPTCTEPGCKEQICVTCGKSGKKEEVPATGHKMTDGEHVEPTCTEPGYSIRYCTKCGEIRKKESPATGHQMETVERTDPTCTEPGVVEEECAYCGKKNTVEIPAAGHAWGEWETVKEPTASAEGEKKRTCSTCGEEETEKIPYNHKHVWVVTYTEPTCEDYGYEVHTCECGESWSVCVKDPIGHNWSEWKTTKEPTKDAVGEKQRTCSNCHETVVEVIPKLSEDGKPYEQHLDPGITVEHYTSTITSYLYGKMIVEDWRSWGDPPSIWVQSDGSLKILYFDLNGNAVEAILTPPEMEGRDPANHTHCVRILDDGTLFYAWYGSYGD